MKNQGMRRVFVLVLISILCLISKSNSESNEEQSVEEDGSSKRHFVLVHGACHGAWCWYKVATLLRSHGHSVTALDLGASGIDPKQVGDVQTVLDYFGPPMEFMEKSVKERVILVGHSLGGLALSKAMESYPHKIAAAVFVTAIMPGPSLNISSIGRESLGGQIPQMDNQFTYGDGTNKPPTSFNFGPKFMASNVYYLSPTEDFILATTLVRPVRLFSEEEQSKDVVLTDQKYGTVPRVYIISEEDKLIDEALLQWMLKNNPPDMVLKIKGSDHMVMFSEPKKLCSCLHKIAKLYF